MSFLARKHLLFNNFQSLVYINRELLIHSLLRFIEIWKDVTRLIIRGQINNGYIINITKILSSVLSRFHHISYHEAFYRNETSHRNRVVKFLECFHRLLLPFCIRVISPRKQSLSRSYVRPSHNYEFQLARLHSFFAGNPQTCIIRHGH